MMITFIQSKNNQEKENKNAILILQGKILITNHVMKVLENRIKIFIEIKGKQFCL